MKTIIHTDTARMIASNPDGFDVDDLLSLCDYIGPGDRPAAQAAALFGRDGDHSIRIADTKLIRDYCWWMARARENRLRGNINRALIAEKQAELKYQALSSDRKW